MSDTEPVVVEVPPVEEPKTEGAEEKATEKDFAEAGFSPEEIDMAKEQGMVEEKKEEGKDNGKKEEGKKEPEAKEKQEIKKEEKIDEELSDADIKNRLNDLRDKDGNITDKHAHGMLSRIRRERRRRQEAENVARRREAENKYLSENLERMKSEREKVEEELNGLKDKDTEFLTDEEKARKAELRAKEKDLKTKEEEINIKTKTDKEKAEKAERASRVLHESEEDFKQAHPDINFDQCAEYASEILKSLNEKTTDSLLGDEMKSAYAERLARRFVENSVKLANGEIIDEELPEIVHKMAKIHPKYNNGSNTEMKGKDVTDGKIKPGQSNIDRMIRNADRRNTAAITGAGGGRIKVSEEDLTWSDAVRLPKREFDKLSQPTIDRLLKESCAGT